MQTTNQAFSEISNVHEARHQIEIPSDLDKRLCDWARSSAMSSTERLRRVVIEELAQTDPAFASLPPSTAGTFSVHRALTLPRSAARQIEALARTLGVAPEQVMAGIIQSRLNARLAA